MEQQSAEVWAYLNSMCCMELLRTVDVVLKDPDYEKNEYTPLVRDILVKCNVRKIKPTPKQATSIKTHLAYNSRLWY
jgi:hypothetical protein